MSTSTPRALLVLPDPSENYNVLIRNANDTAIDGHLGFAPFTSSTRPASAFSGRSIRETDTEKLYYSKGTAPISASWVQIFTAQADLTPSATASLIFGGDTTINRLSAGTARTTSNWRVDGNETVIGTTTASGAVTMNSSLLVNGTATACGSLAGWGGAWTSYTPTLTNVTLGTGGTITARYYQLGKFVFVQAQIILGTSGMAVTGSFILSLPVTARSTTPVLWGSGICLDSSLGSTGHRGVHVLANNTTSAVLVSTVGGIVNATQPFTWAASDEARVEFWYEAA